MKISVIGAYGFTGKLISSELQKVNLKFSVYGRNQEKLDGLKAEHSCIDNAQSIDLRKLEDVKGIIVNSDLIINCAGPFTEESALMLSEIAKSGKIYLDITGEVGFVRDSKSKYHETAVQNSSLIIHGCAFESLIADLGTEVLLQETKSPKSIFTFYQFDQLRASPGTKMTMKLSKFRESLMVRNGQWDVSDFEKDQLHVTTYLNDELIAIPYPLPEIAYNQWNNAIDSAASFLLVGTKEASLLGGKPAEEADTLETLDEIRLRKRKGPNAEQRADQKSNLVIYVIDENKEHHSLLMQSTDMYLTTAKAIVTSVQQISKLENVPSGVLSPAELFKNEEVATLQQLDIVLNKEASFEIS